MGGGRGRSMLSGWLVSLELLFELLFDLHGVCTGIVNPLKGIQNITNKVDGIYWPKIAALCRDMKSKEMMNTNINILYFMKYFG